MKFRNFLSVTLAVLALLLMAGCGVTPEQVDQAVATVENLSPSELSNLAGTVQALPPEQIVAAETAAAIYGVPTVSSEQVTAVVATVQAARTTATAVGQAAEAGERVNATQVPDSAPRIIYFFAQVPSRSGIEAGVRYYLNWTTENANRVEIFGNVMDNPQQGSWPVYNEANDWVLWAGNDQAWVEQFLQVTADSGTGNTLQDVSVNSQNITLTLRDPQFVDGDVINIDVNGVRILDRFTTGGRHVSFPIALNSGANMISIGAQNEGVTAPMVAELTVSNISSGPAVQITGGLRQGEVQSFTVTAP
jgi:outer membrane murein-binding lipoprotein Lpp